MSDDTPEREDADAPKVPQAGTRTCPICGAPAVERYKPFCSRRCAYVDLNRWLSGGYAIPVAPDEDEDGEGPQPQG